MFWLFFHLSLPKLHALHSLYLFIFVETYLLYFFTFYFLHFFLLLLLLLLLPPSSTKLLYSYSDFMSKNEDDDVEEEEDDANGSRKYVCISSVFNLFFSVGSKSNSSDNSSNSWSFRFNAALDSAGADTTAGGAGAAMYAC